MSGAFLTGIAKRVRQALLYGAIALALRLFLFLLSLRRSGEWAGRLACWQVFSLWTGVTATKHWTCLPAT